MKTLTMLPNELQTLKNGIDKLYYKGNISLFERKKIAIVGSRRPIAYTKTYTYTLASKLSKSGFCIVSGAAMGVDAIAHQGAGYKNTIAVIANGLDIRYPKINQTLIKEIEEQGLVISRFEPGFLATPWSFVVRNEIVVALSDAVIITQADLNSGSIRSAEFALKHNKPIYVLPHRIGDSEGTNRLLKEQKATAIYDVNEFIDMLQQKSSLKQEIIKDEFYEFCSNAPTYEEALKLFGDRVFEEELNGKIEIKEGKVRLV